MRSGKPDLDDVVARFEDWRANKQDRLIPRELWRAALGLLDRYSAYAVCQGLRISPARLQQVRQQGGRKGRRLVAKGTTAKASSATGGAFVELPALGVAVGGVTAAGFRLVLESATGTLTLVSRTPGEELAEAACRLVREALGGGCRP